MEDNSFYEIVKDWSPSDLEPIAKFIAGDDTGWYRTYGDLVELLKEQRPRVEPYSTTRWRFALERLRELQEEPENLETVLLKTVDPRAFRSNSLAQELALERLNDLLAPDGFNIELVMGKPKVRYIGFDESSEAVNEVGEIDISDLITDVQKSRLVQDRFDDALLSLEAAAHLSSVIMFGSGLEGLLLFFCQEHVDVNTQQQFLPSSSKSSKQKRLNELTLQELISFSHDAELIETDAQKFSDVLRDFRNLVHPWKQLQGQYTAPNSGTLRMFVVVIQELVEDLREWKEARHV